MRVRIVRELCSRMRLLPATFVLLLLLAGCDEHKQAAAPPKPAVGVKVATMKGVNPDGSHYSDPGVPWVSYFHGGDALHGFVRGSYGWPQSLGCVEMPPSNAATVYPYTPIGTLVTVHA